MASRLSNNNPPNLITNTRGISYSVLTARSPKGGGIQTSLRKGMPKASKSLKPNLEDEESIWKGGLNNRNIFDYISLTKYLKGSLLSDIEELKKLPGGNIWRLPSTTLLENGKTIDVNAIRCKILAEHFGGAENVPTELLDEVFPEEEHRKQFIEDYNSKSTNFQSDFQNNAADKNFSLSPREDNAEKGELKEKTANFARKSHFVKISNDVLEEVGIEEHSSVKNTKKRIFAKNSRGDLEEISEDEREIHRREARDTGDFSLRTSLDNPFGLNRRTFDSECFNFEDRSESRFAGNSSVFSRSKTDLKVRLVPSDSKDSDNKLKNISVNQKEKETLESIGLRGDLTDEELRQYMEELGDGNLHSKEHASMVLKLSKYTSGGSDIYDDKGVSGSPVLYREEAAIPSEKKERNQQFFNNLKSAKNSEGKSENQEAESNEIEVVKSRNIVTAEVISDGSRVNQRSQAVFKTEKAKAHYQDVLVPVTQEGNSRMNAVASDGISEGKNSSQINQNTKAGDYFEAVNQKNTKTQTKQIRSSLAPALGNGVNLISSTEEIDSSTIRQSDAGYSEGGIENINLNNNSIKNKYTTKTGNGQTSPDNSSVSKVQTENGTTGDKDHLDINSGNSKNSIIKNSLTLEPLANSGNTGNNIEKTFGDAFSRQIKESKDHKDFATDQGAEGVECLIKEEEEGFIASHPLPSEVQTTGISKVIRDDGLERKSQLIENKSQRESLAESTSQKTKLQQGTHKKEVAGSMESNDDKSTRLLKHKTNEHGSIEKSYAEYSSFSEEQAMMENTIQDGRTELEEKLLDVITKGKQVSKTGGFTKSKAKNDLALNKDSGATGVTDNGSLREQLQGTSSKQKDNRVLTKGSSKSKKGVDFRIDEIESELSEIPMNEFNQEEDLDTFTELDENIQISNSQKTNSKARIASKNSTNQYEKHVQNQGLEDEYDEVSKNGKTVDGFVLETASASQRIREHEGIKKNTITPLNTHDKLKLLSATQNTTDPNMEAEAEGRMISGNEKLINRGLSKNQKKDHLEAAQISPNRVSKQGLVHGSAEVEGVSSKKLAKINKTDHKSQVDKQSNKNATEIGVAYNPKPRNADRGTKLGVDTQYEYEYEGEAADSGDDGYEYEYIEEVEYDYQAENSTKNAQSRKESDDSRGVLGQRSKAETSAQINKHMASTKLQKTNENSNQSELIAEKHVRASEQESKNSESLYKDGKKNNNVSSKNKTPKNTEEPIKSGGRQTEAGIPLIQTSNSVISGNSKKAPSQNKTTAEGFAIEDELIEDENLRVDPKLRKKADLNKLCIPEDAQIESSNEIENNIKKGNDVKSRKILQKGSKKFLKTDKKHDNPKMVADSNIDSLNSLNNETIGCELGSKVLNISVLSDASSNPKLKNLESKTELDLLEDDQVENPSSEIQNAGEKNRKVKFKTPLEKDAKGLVKVASHKGNEETISDPVSHAPGSRSNQSISSQDKILEKGTKVEDTVSDKSGHRDNPKSNLPKTENPSNASENENSKVGSTLRDIQKKTGFQQVGNVGTIDDKSKVKKFLQKDTKTAMKTDSSRADAESIPEKISQSLPSATIGKLSSQNVELTKKADPESKAVEKNDSSILVKSSPTTEFGPSKRDKQENLKELSISEQLQLQTVSKQIGIEKGGQAKLSSEKMDPASKTNQNQSNTAQDASITDSDSRNLKHGTSVKQGKKTSKDPREDSSKNQVIYEQQEKVFYNEAEDSEEEIVYYEEHEEHEGEVYRNSSAYGEAAESQRSTVQSSGTKAQSKGKESGASSLSTSNSKNVLFNKIMEKMSGSPASKQHAYDFQATKNEGKEEGAGTKYFSELKAGLDVKPSLTSSNLNAKNSSLEAPFNNTAKNTTSQSSKLVKNSSKMLEDSQQLTHDIKKPVEANTDKNKKLAAFKTEKNLKGNKFPQQFLESESLNSVSILKQDSYITHTGDQIFVEFSEPEAEIPPTDVQMESSSGYIDTPKKTPFGKMLSAASKFKSPQSKAISAHKINSKIASEKTSEMESLGNSNLEYFAEGNTTKKFIEDNAIMPERSKTTENTKITEGDKKALLVSTDISKQHLKSELQKSAERTDGNVSPGNVKSESIEGNLSKSNDLKTKTKLSTETPNKNDAASSLGTAVSGSKKDNNRFKGIANKNLEVQTVTPTDKTVVESNSRFRDNMKGLNLRNIRSKEIYYGDSLSQTSQDAFSSNLSLSNNRESAQNHTLATRIQDSTTPDSNKAQMTNKAGSLSKATNLKSSSHTIKQRPPSQKDKGLDSSSSYLNASNSEAKMTSRSKLNDTAENEYELAGPNNLRIKPKLEITKNPVDFSFEWKTLPSQKKSSTKEPTLLAKVNSSTTSQNQKELSQKSLQSSKDRDLNSPFKGNKDSKALEQSNSDNLRVHCSPTKASRNEIEINQSLSNSEHLNLVPSPNLSLQSKRNQSVNVQLTSPRSNVTQTPENRRQNQSESSTLLVTINDKKNASNKLANTSSPNKKVSPLKLSTNLDGKEIQGKSSLTDRTAQSKSTKEGNIPKRNLLTPNKELNDPNNYQFDKGFQQNKMVAGVSTKTKSSQNNPSQRLESPIPEKLRDAKNSKSKSATKPRTVSKEIGDANGLQIITKDSSIKPNMRVNRVKNSEPLSVIQIFSKRRQDFEELEVSQIDTNRSLDLETRSLAWDMKRKLKISEQQKSKEEQDFKECTFAPKLNSNTDKILLKSQAAEEKRKVIETKQAERESENAEKLSKINTGADNRLSSEEFNERLYALNSGNVNNRPDYRTLGQIKAESEFEQYFPGLCHSHACPDTNTMQYYKDIIKILANRTDEERELIWKEIEKAFLLANSADEVKNGMAQKTSPERKKLPGGQTGTSDFHYLREFKFIDNEKKVDWLVMLKVFLTVSQRVTRTKTKKEEPQIDRSSTSFDQSLKI